MKVKDFINLFKELKYDDTTELLIGGADFNGDWHDFDFEVEDEDRKYNPIYNYLSLSISPSEDYINAICDERFDVDNVSRRIYEDVRWILTHDEN